MRISEALRMAADALGNSLGDNPEYGEALAVVKPLIGAAIDMEALTDEVSILGLLFKDSYLNMASGEALDNIACGLARRHSFWNEWTPEQIIRIMNRLNELSPVPLLADDIIMIRRMGVNLVNGYTQLEVEVEEFIFHIEIKE